MSCSFRLLLLCLPLKKEEPETVSENKLSYEAQKELNKKIRKLEKRIADCEQKNRKAGN